MVLLTGASGFIGRRLLGTLWEQSIKSHPPRDPQRWASTQSAQSLR